MGVYFLFLIQDILAVLFVSLILASAIDPWVDWLQERQISRGLSVVLIYIIVFSILFIVTTLIVPPIKQEFDQLLLKTPQYFDSAILQYEVIKDYLQNQGILSELRQNLGSVSSGIQGAATGLFSTVAGFIGGILSFFLILVITFYMVVEENAIKKLIFSVSPKRYQEYMIGLVNRMQRKIGLWLRGQIVLSFSIFVLTYIGLSVLSYAAQTMGIIAVPFEYVLVLSLIAGLTEFVPYLGPILGAIPAIFLASVQSPTLALMVLALYYIIQLTENNILVPKIMQKVVGLSPIVSISVLMIGFKLAGVVGAIMSIPVATAVQEMILDVFEYKEKGSIKT